MAKLTEQRHLLVEQRHLLVEQRHLLVEQRHLLVEQRHLLVEQRHLLVEQRHLLVEQRHLLALHVTFVARIARKCMNLGLLRSAPARRTLGAMLRIALALLLAGSLGCQTKAKSPPPRPLELTAIAIDGTGIDVSTLKGKPWVIDLWRVT